MKILITLGGNDEPASGPVTANGVNSVVEAVKVARVAFSSSLVFVKTVPSYSLMSRMKFVFENEVLHAKLRKQEKRIMNWPLFTKTFEGKGKLRRSEKIEAEVMKGR